jgi:hypothetical protein
MTPRDILVATHGHCFDGMASAALFTWLRRALEPDLSFAMRYKSCGYGPGMSMIPEAWLDGEESAILDFRFTPSKRLRWYFDHHVTGFGSPEERDAAFARREQSEARLDVHFDPDYGSCTKLIADVARERYGLDPTALTELVSWADTIDAARFPSAEAATSREEPVLQLASVVEHHGDGPFLNAVVPQLLEKPVVEVARSEAIQSLWRPLRTSQEAFVERVQRGARPMGNVVLVDLSNAPLEVGAKFVTYALFPSCVYSVTLTRNKQHYKLSVGYNPWSGVPRVHDIASICRRYDGGGHAAVGACSFPLSALDRSRAAAEAVVRELSA